MEATKFLSSTNLLHRPGVSCLLPCRKNSTKPYILSMTASRGSKGRDYEGRLVDENMIVLRMRIQENKLLETSHEPPSNWLEWEKKYYVHYNEDICEAMGLLQNYLMNTRPGLALGMIAVVVLSVAISTGVLLFQAVEIAKNYLMNTRPGLALGMIPVVVLSVAISTGVLLFQAVEIAKVVLLGSHLM